MLPLKEPLWFSSVPHVALTWPFLPSSLSFLRMMFRMPATPSGSYLAVGLVMISTRSMLLAGICSSRLWVAEPVIPEGRPSMRMVTLPEPRRLRLPSMSTSMLGTLRSNSVAVDPALLRSSPTRNTLRSIIISRLDLCSTTSAASKACMLGSRRSVPRSCSVPPRGLSRMSPTSVETYPMKPIWALNRPMGISVMRKRPLASVTPPVMTLSSSKARMEMVANSMGVPESPSSTLPKTTPILGRSAMSGLAPDGR